MQLEKTLAALAALRADAANLAIALHKHLAVTAHGELHGFLHRMHAVVCDFQTAIANTPVPR